MNRLLHLSGSRLAQLIRHKEVSSREVVEAHIDRIRATNDQLNAVVEERFGQARKEADRADERVAKSRGVLPPFLGVPCTIKECFEVEGMPNTSGLVSRQGLRATRDATAVARLRAAGVIPLGVTNVSELCMWMEANNKVYGKTSNPYDPARTVGGSSGGEGAIIGAGGSPFGLGSDIGGSIRMPAFFNGVFGHKPTGGLVPGTGQHPIAENAALRYLTTGPLARRADDLMPLLSLLAGPDAKDSGCLEMKLGDPTDVSISALTVIEANHKNMRHTSAEIRDAVDRSIHALVARGARYRKVDLGGLDHSLQIWFAMMKAAAETSFGTLLGGGVEVRLGRQILAWAGRRCDHTLPALCLAALERVWLPKKMQQGFVDQGLALRQKLNDVIGPNGILIYPPYARVAPRHYHPLLSPFAWVRTAIFNTMELPVTQVPIGLNKRGLPLGVQVVGIHGNDHVTIAVGKQLEEILAVGCRQVIDLGGVPR